MKKLGLIGYPLSHSFSKKYFENKFSEQQIKEYVYDLYPLKQVEEINALLLQHPELCGLNVTIPYKEQVIPFLQELDETAAAVGAVNCIKIKTENGIRRLIGYNTDVFGFRQSIKPFLEPQHEKALIIGTGGASKAVAYVLNQIGVACWFVSRDKMHTGKENCFNYSELNDYTMKAFKLIVNTSPVGMYPHTGQCPDLPYDHVEKGHLFYDLVYNPEETLFMKKGRERGAVAVNGLSMLYHQADKAWEIWRN